MKIEEIRRLYAQRPQVKALSKELGIRNEELGMGSRQTAKHELIPHSSFLIPHSFLLTGLTASSAAIVLSALDSPRPILIVMSDIDEAGYFYQDLVHLLGEERVLFFPSSYKQGSKNDQRDPAQEILRTEALAQLGGHAEGLYVVSYPQALTEPVPSRHRLTKGTITLRRGQATNVSDLLQRMRQLGMQETDYVYEPGQFALRGSILDVFSYSSEQPVRIDFFGDDIDTIRHFDIVSQLSTAKLDATTIVPSLTDTGDDLIPLLDFLPDNTILASRDLQFVADTVDEINPDAHFQERAAHFTQISWQAGRDELGMRNEKLGIGSRQTAIRKPIPNSSFLIPNFSFDTRPQPLFHKNFDLLEQCLDTYLRSGYRLMILADSPKQHERLRGIFDERQGRRIAFDGVDHTLHEGFIDRDLKLCLLTDHQIFDRFQGYTLRTEKARSGRCALTLKELKAFQVGDYVVHIDHGVGRFGGLVRLPEAGGFQEKIKIMYDGGDAVYVSIHALYKVSKYKGADSGEAPKLNRLGTGQWDRLKERTKAKLKDIARDLIRLYAKRRGQNGFAYSPDTYMQHELEASFLYEDTPDQLRATQDVKADMERHRPMDRLVCGDVGFGKTEVAVRAAFKAATDGKQTAVLVPTTVLAYQHYNTFTKRLRDFPVRVDYLTRARTATDTKHLLADLAEGRIDILIGTHKLLGRTVHWKDLGLLIIDEEQKFGVSTKEKLRQLRSNIDTLTMSATPIPRTLQFSLVGARDLSVIQTPPPNRYPIQTEIHTFTADIIAEAIRYEMNRGGQVYFVNNRIDDLTQIARLIDTHVPRARVAIGHGRLKPEELEQIIMDFANYEYDVLLSTTIVENGIDIPNANTIIINQAHHFGLSDLHQMRGRVGRGNRKAYCYLLAPPLSSLSPESRRRLEALENFSDLGSGINIAMQDLDIRGAGNMLGAEQSGFIADLGYETYQKILTQAVTELKNDEFADLYKDQKPATSDFVEDCIVESDLSLCFPEHYVPSDSERMLLYRELDNMRTDDDIQQYRLRLIDRFGPIPETGEELIRIVPLRHKAQKMGIERIVLKARRMTLFFISQQGSPYYQSDTFGHILQTIAAHPKQYKARNTDNHFSIVTGDIKTVKQATEKLEEISNYKQ